MHWKVLSLCFQAHNLLLDFFRIQNNCKSSSCKSDTHMNIFITVINIEIWWKSITVYFGRESSALVTFCYCFRVQVYYCNSRILFCFVFLWFEICTNVTYIWYDLFQHTVGLSVHKICLMYWNNWNTFFYYLNQVVYKY